MVATKEFYSLSSCCHSRSGLFVLPVDGRRGVLVDTPHPSKVGEHVLPL